MAISSRQVSWGGAKGVNEIPAAKGIWDDPLLSEGTKTNKFVTVENLHFYALDSSFFISTNSIIECKPFQKFAI